MRLPKISAPAAPMRIEMVLPVFLVRNLECRPGLFNFCFDPGKIGASPAQTAAVIPVRGPNKSGFEGSVVPLNLNPPHIKRIGEGIDASPIRAGRSRVPETPVPSQAQETDVVPLKTQAPADQSLLSLLDESPAA